jgi:hypothetical protein
MARFPVLDSEVEQLAELRDVLAGAQARELETATNPDSSEHLDAALVVARIADRIHEITGEIEST